MKTTDILKWYQEYNLSAAEAMIIVDRQERRAKAMGKLTPWMQAEFEAVRNEISMIDNIERSA